MKWKLEDSKLVYGVGSKDLYYLDINKEGKLELVLDDQSITFEKIIEKSFLKRLPLHGHRQTFYGIQLILF